AACEPEVRQSRLLMKSIENVKRDLFQTQLQTRCDVALAIGKRRARLGWWLKHFGKPIRKHAPHDGRAAVPRHLNAFRVVTKVVEVQTKLPVLFGANDPGKIG